MNEKAAPAFFSLTFRCNIFAIIRAVKHQENPCEVRAAATKTPYEAKSASVLLSYYANFSF